MASSNHDKFATERIFLFFKFIYAYSTRIIFFSKCYFKANSDLLVFYKGFTVYIETFLINFPKPQKKGNYRFKERELYSFWPSHACRNFCPW